MSKYEPGKRHWLKLKKDYLNEGAMADSADLVVLGAWFGTGNRGGIMSIFLMGCFDRRRKRWCTVTKVHGGECAPLGQGFSPSRGFSRSNSPTGVFYFKVTTTQPSIGCKAN